MLFIFLVLISQISLDEVSDPRYPSVAPDGSEIVFCWRGQLWTSPLSGGTPRCLTPGDARVSHPFYSHDGTMIAYTNEVTGGGDVYVMPSGGGVATRLTYHSGSDRVLGWDADDVLFSSSREGGSDWVWRVPVSGGTPRLELPASVKNLFVSSDGYVVETGYTPWWRRHYRGSASSSLWKVRNGEFTPILHLDLDQRWPFCDADGDVIFVMEDDAGLDRFFDSNGKPLSPPVPGGITFPSVSADGSVVVFESDGKLIEADLPEMTMKEISVSAGVDLPFPLEQLSFAGVYTSDFSVAPDASYLVMESEGEIYAAVTDDSGLDDAVRITTTAALESRPRISSDGKKVLFQREHNGTVELMVGDAELTDDGKVCITNLLSLDTGLDVSLSGEWSPSGDISFLDSQGFLYVFDMQSGRTRKVCDESQIQHHSWSPDSRWLAFSKTVDAHREDVFIVPAEGGEAVNVSRHPNDDFQPLWPSDGRRLLWASRTDDGSYFIVQAWFLPEDWEAQHDEREELLDDPMDVVPVDTDGLYMRTEELCEVEGYYDFFGITPDGREIYFPSTDTSGEMDLYSVDWDGENLTRETYGAHSPTRIQPMPESVGGAVYYLSHGSTIRVLDGDVLSWSAPYSGFRDEMQRQKFLSAWRQLRDSFYDTDMHGVNWEAMRDKYLERAVAALDNEDFNDVVRRMLGELSSSHLGIYGPWEYRKTAYTGETGILPDYSYDGAGMRIDSILPMSPADLAGLQKGDVVVTINGETVGPESNFYAPLRNTADRETLVSFRRLGTLRQITLTPIPAWDLWKLTYQQWLINQRRRVSRLSGDRVGYLHIPAMNQRSVRNFRRDLYAEGLGRDAMIVDVRGNGGGSTHDQILASLARDTYAVSRDRSGHATLEPLGVWKKPLVLIINETCYSDAEIFPAAWEELDLGPVVGNTTYGAVIGTEDIELADGTVFRLPGTGWYTLEGDDLENRGVAPDVLVLEMPDDRGRGMDPQLDAAVAAALELI